MYKQDVFLALSLSLLPHSFKFHLFIYSVSEMVIESHGHILSYIREGGTNKIMSSLLLYLYFMKSLMPLCSGLIHVKCESEKKPVLLSSVLEPSVTGPSMPIANTTRNALRHLL